MPESDADAGSWRWAAPPARRSGTTSGAYDTANTVEFAPRRPSSGRVFFHTGEGFLMRKFGGLLVLGVAATAALVVHAQQGANATNGTRGAKPYTTWHAYGGGAHSSQYSALNQINKSNVSQLERRLDLPGQRHRHLQPADHRRHDVSAGDRATPSSRSTPRPARRCGGTPTRAASAPAASTTGRAPTARTAACSI